MHFLCTVFLYGYFSINRASAKSGKTAPESNERELHN